MLGLNLVPKVNNAILELKQSMLDIINVRDHIN